MGTLKLKAIFVFLILSFFTKLSTGAVLPPSLRCVEVKTSGACILTWVPPADPANEFLNYVVFYSNNPAGPFSQVVVNNIATTSTTISVNANVGSFYFYVVSNFDDGSGPTLSVASDTAKSILPVFAAVSDSTSTVIWNKLFTPNIGTSNGVYTIHRKKGVTGSFVNLGNQNYGVESQDDSFKVCSDSLYYYVEISDQSGCVSKSAILKDLFQDNTAPAIPVIDSVSVVGNPGVVSLGWKPSTSLDTEGYYVIYYEPVTGNYIIRDTIFGINSTFYQENLPAIDPEVASQQFTISAFDTCYKPNPNTSAAALDQKTIYLELQPDNCANSVTLVWTSYINWSDLDRYEVYVSENGQPYTLAQNISSSDTSYVFQKSDPLAVYCFKIKAVNVTGTKTSTSNKKCATASSGVAPSVQYFKEITVENNQFMHIESVTDSLMPVEEYVLLRSLERFNNFFEVDRIPSTGGSVIAMNDFEAHVNQTGYFYKIGLIDTCGVIIYLSPAVSSVFLEGDLNEDSLFVDLTWNDYLGWDTVNSSIQLHNIWMNVDGQSELIDSVTAGVNTYTYRLVDAIEDGAEFCFYIQTVESNGNPLGYQDTVRSNEVCFSKNVQVYVPNAFRPGGMNPIFKPVVSFGNVQSYLMKIYDRWGGVVFETTQIEEGWDGMVGERLAEVGAYAYEIRVLNFAGAELLKRGTFVMLK